ncbi:GDSL esterase/lipase 1-like [Benincasa hispida]|uniref:GDSL esterase/lipase 1-like n=1 Tax=Benincasa hispida TaxID=102211 RepID=UPI0019020B11|nr:GDSL esterase/lipase 1-like [Benincasa hispida]
MANSNNWSLCVLLLLIFYPVGECVVCKQDELLQQHIPLFVFGDSIIDTGNNNYINTIPTAQSNYPPFGQTFFKYPSGRWSDGRVVPDFFAEYANLPLVFPYLYPGNKRYIDGINFASGGAGALDEVNRGFGVISLKTQAKSFNKVERILRKQLGKTQAKMLLSRGVYLITIGTNDYRTFASDSKLFDSYSVEEYVDLVIENLTSVIKDIHKKGGRKFVAMNLWSYNHVPAVLEAVASQGKYARLEQLNQLVELHNKQLYKALQKLATKLEGFRYSYVDSYKVFEEITSNPAKYGFKEVKDACCGSGKYKGIQSCGGMGDVKEYELCGNPKEHLFFDSNHGSDRAYQILAEMAWNGDSSTSTPVNVKSLFHS